MFKPTVTVLRWRHNSSSKQCGFKSDSSCIAQHLTFMPICCMTQIFQSNHILVVSLTFKPFPVFISTFHLCCLNSFLLFKFVFLLRTSSYFRCVIFFFPDLCESLCHCQVKQRADECILALDKLTEINSGIAVQNVLQTQFDWTTLEVVTFSSTFFFCQQAV